MVFKYLWEAACKPLPFDFFLTTVHLHVNLLQLVSAASQFFNPHDKYTS